jgi:tRNA threonylcarbamoyladenosine biosynthesis protein TsaB
MLLAVDTSTQWIGLAVYQDEQILTEEVWQSRAHHSVELSPALQLILQRSGITAKDLSVIAVATGPGSFTSLRIGMAVVKGLALGLHIPVIGIPTLDILAAGVPVQPVRMAAVLQAGRGRLAVGWYDARDGVWQSQGDLEVMTPAELEQVIKKPTLVCGELSVSERKTLARRWKNVVLASPAVSVRRPAYLAELAWKRWQNMDVDDVVSMAPTYLHYKDPIPG